MKTKLILLSLLALLASIVANAESSLLIGSGDSKVSAPIDFYNTDSYQGAEIIYLYDEIKAIKGLTITAIEFNYSNPNSSASPSLSFELRIGTTSSQMFSSTTGYLINASNSSSRGSATLSAQSGTGWIRIPLDNPYTISSSSIDNLVIDLRNTERGGYLQNVSFLGTNIGESRTIRWNSASSSTSTNTGTLSDILPNVRFIFNTGNTQIDIGITSPLTGETGVTAITCNATGQLPLAYSQVGKPKKLLVKGIVSNSDIQNIFDDENRHLDYFDLSEAEISEGYIYSTSYGWWDDGDWYSVDFGKFILPNTLQKISFLSRKAYVYSSSPYTIENLSDQLYVPSSSKSAWKAAVQRYGENGIVLSGEPLSVNLATAGTLQSTLGLSNWQYPNVEYLTISGKMNGTDFNFLKNFTNLEILNILADIVGEKIPDNAFQNFKELRKFYYQPNSWSNGTFIDIGSCAFDGCEKLFSFKTSYYTMIKSIGDFAFRNTKIYDIYLNSTKCDWDDSENITSGAGSGVLTSIGKNPFFGTPYGRKFSYIDFSPGGDYSDPTWNIWRFELIIYPESLDDGEPDVQQILSQDKKTLYAAFTAESELTLCPSVVTIQDYGLSSIGSSTVILNSQLKTLGEAFLYRCANLTNIQISGNPYYQAEEGVLYNVGKTILIKYPCAKTTTLFTIPSSVVLIEDYAFERASKLEFICVDNETPPTVFANSFENIDKSSVTLIVPAGCKTIYQTADYWKDFGIIVENVIGDVNGDEEIDVVDVVDIARYVVGTPAETFVPILADINNNGEVNIADAVCLVNEIAGDQNFSRAMHAPRMVTASEEALTLNANGENGLSLALLNEREYTAFQFDLYVPKGTDVTQMLLNAQRKQKHQLLFNKVEEGHWRIAALSTSNRTFTGNDGELLSITLDVLTGEEIAARNILFFDAAGNSYRFNDIMMNGTTMIQSMDSGQLTMENSSTVYDLQGRKMVNSKSSNSQLSRGIYIVNGKKVVIK